MITFSDGTQYESGLHLALGQPIPTEEEGEEASQEGKQKGSTSNRMPSGGNRKPAGEFKSPTGTQVASSGQKYKEPTFDSRWEGANSPKFEQGSYWYDKDKKQLVNPATGEIMMDLNDPKDTFEIWENEGDPGHMFGAKAGQKYAMADDDVRKGRSVKPEHGSPGGPSGGGMKKDFHDYDQKPFTEEDFNKGYQLHPSVLKTYKDAGIPPPSLKTKTATDKVLEDIANKAVKNIHQIADKFLARNPSSLKGHSLEPIDWQKLQNEFVKPVNLPNSAKEAGFNPNMPIYKGGSRSEPTKRELLNPDKKMWERGLFFSDQPKVAAHYAYDTAKPIEYVARPKNPAVIDLKGKSYNSDLMHDIIEHARDKGHDLVVIRNIYDIGSGAKAQNQIVVTDPTIVRHPTAKFDPNSFHINDILATILGVAGVGTAVKKETEK